MTVLYLIRHATNDYVVEGRLAGWTPGVHINARGQREADELARRLAGVQLEAIYSSPLDRAIDTANSVAACHNLPVQICDDLGEGRLGEWQGRLIKELQELDPWKEMIKNPVHFRPPGGETISEVQRRMVAAVEEIQRRHPEGAVAIVSHADPLKALIAHYLCWDLAYFQRISISPASASVLVLEQDRAHLVLLNHTGDILRIDKPKKETADSTEEQSESMPRDEPRKDQPKMAEANILYDMNPATKLMAGAVGEPGQRVFYLQGRQGTTLVTLQSEKEQVSSLSTGIFDLLDRMGDKTGKGAVSSYDSMLEEPLEPLFRIGQLGLGYEQDQDLFVIVAYEATAEQDPPAVNVVRFWGTREQMRSLAEHAAEVVAGGRPICVLCGRPIDPQGHFCPRRNGHGARATLN